jgi:phospholipid/cholesterol/gamma-HCH transport system permease protein
VGVQVQSETALDLLAEHGVRVDRTAQIATFPPEIVLAAMAQAPRRSVLQRTGRAAAAGGMQARDFVAFVGQVALASAGLLRDRRAWRWRVVWHEVEVGGFDALPIIGVTAFLLGVVVAYQGADQLRHYGANVFVVELVGYAMLREFAPLISAIIIAGRSGSAHAAQIGTMVVTEEIDAMRTLGIDPLQRLALPKLLAMALSLPLLTVFADLCGVLGGMVMARSQLGIGFGEFVDRFGRVMQGTALLIGLGKSLVFALIIATVGCFQGLRTSGSADSVGRQTTLSVVQSIFTIIVADALFSVAFNLMGL